MHSVPQDDPQALHVCRLWRCFLCLDRLPYQDSPVRPPWASELISLFPCTASDGSVRVLLETTDVDSIWSQTHWHKQRWATDALGSKRLVHFCDNGLDRARFCAQRDPDRVIFYAHRCCWKIANVPVLIEPLVLLRFAFQTRPFDNWPTSYDSYEFHAQNDPSNLPEPPLFDMGTKDLLPFDGRLFNNATDVGGLVSRLTKLPLEIQFQVTKRLNLTLFLSLLKTNTLVTQLLHQVCESTTMKPEMRTLDHDGTFSRIHVRYRIIMGTSYFADIWFKGESDGEAMSIPVAHRAVRGVQFSLGRFGLKGIRVLYDDDTPSSWLGEPSSGWLGVARGRDLSRLRVVADALRIIRLDFCTIGLDCRHSLKVPPERNPVMWYGDFPSENLVKRSFPPPHPGALQWVRRLDYYPRWKQCQYLGLNTESGYTSGLTVYLDSSLEHLTGIKSHGHSDLTLGRPWGVPIHFALRRGEHVTSAWLHVWGYYYGTLNCFSVTTNHGRVRHFGDYRVARQHRCKPQPRDDGVPCRWIRISDERPARIDGIFIDANEYLRRGQLINTVGVAQRKQSSQIEGGTDGPCSIHLEIPPSITPPPESPFSLTPNNPGFFYSTASLNNIRELRVRRNNGRCLGMHLLYGDSTVETLGQWDPTNGESIQKIYEATDGVLMRLIFHSKLDDSCLLQPQIELISVEATAKSWPLHPPGETISDQVNSYVQDLEAGEESITPCGSCGGSRCCDGGLRRESMVKAFDCSEPGKIIAWWSGYLYETVSLDDSQPQVKVKSASKVAVNWSAPQLSEEESSGPPFVVVD